MSETDDVAQKQEYLRVAILDEGYNPELFSEYITSLKGIQIFCCGLAYNSSK